VNFPTNCLESSLKFLIFPNFTSFPYKMAKIAVGIDLGTTYSCIAAYVNNKFEVLTDYNGNKTIPSFVVFSSGRPEVGHVAKENFLVDPANRVYGK
jgi:molecular chaperone DnaK (HSP70)